MAEEIGIAKHAPKTKVKTKWNYESLKYDRPPEAPEIGNWVTSIYRGLVPAKNIEKRDFAIAGASVSCVCTIFRSLFTDYDQVRKQF